VADPPGRRRASAWVEPSEQIASEYWPVHDPRASTRSLCRMRSPSSDLSKLLHDYAASALQYLRTHTSCPTHTVATYGFDGSGATLVNLRRVSLDPLIQLQAKALEQLPEVRPLAQAMPGYLKELAGTYAIAAVQSYLRGRSNWRYDRGAFGRHAEAYARMWKVETFELVSSSLVSGIELGARALHLADGVDLFPVSDAQRTGLFRFSPENDLGVSELMAIKASACVRTRHSLKEIQGGNYGRLLSGYHEKVLERILTALQLGTASLPRRQRTLTWFEPQPLWYVTSAGQLSTHRHSAVGDCRRVDGLERRQTRKIYAALGDKMAQTLDVALRRLDASVQKGVPEDAIVDLVIALEVTLNAGARPDSLTKQMQLRALAVLGDAYPEIDRELGLLYSIRGKIVHHGMNMREALAASHSTQALAAALAVARERVRQVIARYLEFVVDRRAAPGEINAEMDRAVRIAVASAGRKIRKSSARTPAEDAAKPTGGE
jgi:hypothetical protein